MLENAKRINRPPSAADARSGTPLVVATEPEAFQRDVSPNLNKITVTFDRRMTDQGWSWTGGGETYPKVTGRPSYNADRTVCTLPVQLEPGKAYWVGVNSPSHRNFQSASHIPAQRYVILFATAGPDGKPTDIPEDMLAEARRINAASVHAFGSGTGSSADRLKAEALAAKGWKLWNQQQYEKAEEAFEQSVKLGPTNPHAWNGLGWSQFNQGKPSAAQEAFEKAVQLEPKHAGALNGLGWLAKGQGEKEQAIEYWEKAVAALPTGSAALNGLASTYMEDGEYEKAAKYYQMWLKAEPENKDAKAGLAKAKEKMN
jgi:tetratricopeptide (TPR) repeat protein